MSLSKREYDLRANFAGFCAQNQYYFSLLLLGQATVSVKKELPALAAVSCVAGEIGIFFREDIFDLWEKSGKAAYFVMMHEIRHIIQCADFRYSVDMIDVSPVLYEFGILKSKASTPEMQNYWQEQIDIWSDIKNIRENKQLSYIINLAMDAALHEDLRKLIPGAIEEVEEFVLDKKEKIEIGDISKNSKKQAILKKAKNKFPKDEEKALNEYIKNVGVLCTKESLDIHWHIDNVFSPVLPENGEWVIYANEGVKFLAKQLQSHDPDEKLPEPAEGDGDSHDFDGEERSSCEVRGKIQAAKNEAQKWAHKAGKSIGDLAFESKYVELNKKLNKTLNAINIKMTHILKESSNSEYTYSTINRLYSEIDYLPGNKKTMKPSPSVVLVVDTSGSMWDSTTLNQLAATARMFYNKSMLAKFYCCDVELIEMNIKNPNSIKLEGGGGTVFDDNLAMKIVSDLKTKRKVDIIYITDEMVCGLETTKNNKKYKVHVINIHKMGG